ncbi:hypothetical protein AZI86_09240 [Bdellovibrio bacteriovorus]|uniref:Uncharacterized protein n=1 Tax=Bdellovibrio bacteriovorus TaxID=959 RepID=A0A150WRP1_BDEBC|nr:hypothetical protein [Bdellovibrio bacteriovorus]KYG67183.1 hypothetical protein AZI86_09240 [Bdellovibrio bacteriovorus]
MKLKLILSLMMLIVFQFETGLGDEVRSLGGGNSLQDQSTKKFIKELNQESSRYSGGKESLLNSEILQKKVLEGLKKDFNSEEFLNALGPGVTGGGDSCEQKIAYSFSFLARLVANGRIDLANYGVQNHNLMRKIESVQLRFGSGLNVGRPVEMINVPPNNLIILDRKICQNSFEPLYYYTPLLLHEVLRLVGVEEGRDYAISASFIPLIQKEIRKSLNQGRRFRILSDSGTDRLALAWGVKGQIVDFEAMDEKSHDEQWDFFFQNEANVENYLVDLKTMQILAVVRGGGEDPLQGAIAEFSNLINTNHNRIDLKYEENTGIGITSGYAKWWGGMETIFALKENAIGQKEVIGFCNENCENDIIKPAMYAQMTKAQIKDYEQYGANNTYFQTARDPKSGHAMWKVTITGEVIKGDGYVSYSGLMRLTFENGKFKAVFGKVVKDKR